MSWKDDKDLGPWEFDEQLNKWGYLNNPRWSSLPKAVEFSEAVGNPIDTTDTHKPCGHWHKGDTAIENSTDVTTYTYITYHLGSWWQQSLDIGDSAAAIIYRGLTNQMSVVNKPYIKNNAVTCNRQGIAGATVGNSRIFTAAPSPDIYIGAANYDYNQMAVIKSDAAAGIDSVILVSEYINDDNPYIDGVEFDSISIEPPSVIRCSDYTVIANLVWSSEETPVLVCGVKRDGEDQYWKVVVDNYDDYMADDSSIVFVVSPYSCEAFDGGTIIFCYAYDNYVSGDFEIYVIRSTDYGVSWGSEILVSSTDRNVASIKKSDNGYLYVFSYYSRTAKIYISTDEGLTWSEKDLPDLLAVPTQNPYGYTGFDVDSSGVIYVAISRSSFFSLYVSSDGGDNWTRYDHTEITRPSFMAASSTSIIVYGADTLNDSHYLLIKSSDGGVNFTEKVDITALGYGTSLMTLKNNGTIFVWTRCGLQDENGWLAWLISKDDGDTWIEDSIEDLMSYDNEVIDTQEILTGTDVTTVTTELNEPQVWQI